jgi:hypothetical protein
MPIKLYDAGEDTREKVAGEAEKVIVILTDAYVFREEIVDLIYKITVIKTMLAVKESFK